VAVNKTEALKWYLVAADLGQPYAQDKVDALEAELAAETAA
jgi:TPR repeat protein